MNHTLQSVLAWLGTLYGVGWLSAVPVYLYKHSRQVGQVVTTAEDLVREVRELKNGYQQTGNVPEVK